MNSFHPNIKFTISQSNTTIDFLDVTIYKGEDFNTSNKLSVKTYQKVNNLYQYLHFTSNHPESIFKGIITGELIRYARTNSTAKEYKKQVERFTERLLNRKYPIRFINEAIKKVNYDKRGTFLKDKTSITIKQPLQRPILKCNLPPNFIKIKRTILEEFSHYNLTRYSREPIFVTLRSNTLKDILVHTKCKLSASDQKNLTEKISVTP